MKAICLISFGFIPFFLNAQFHLQSDFYIASNTELQITAPTTTFNSGSFITDQGISIRSGFFCLWEVLGKTQTTPPILIGTSGSSIPHYLPSLQEIMLFFCKQMIKD